MPPAIAAAIAAIPALVQAGTGIAQTVQANKLRNRERPDYDIPPSVLEAVDIARALGNQTRMPGAGIMEDRIASSTGQGVQAIKEIGASGASRLGAVTDLHRNNQIANQDLEMQNAQWVFGNKQALMGELGKLGAYEDNKSEWEDRLSHMSDAAAASALSNSGLQNMFGGVDNAAAGTINAFGYGNSSNPLNRISNPYQAGVGGTGPDFDPHELDMAQLRNFLNQDFSIKPPK